MKYPGLRVMKKAFLRRILTSILIASFWSLTAQSQTATQSQGRLLRKSADIGADQVQGKTTQAGQPRITIRLQGLQPTDLVNIRPAEGKRLEVVAATLAKSAAPQSSSMPVPTMQPGPPLPDSAVEVAPRLVIYTRQAIHGNIVVLDIQVPHDVQVKVELDGRTILKASLRQPLSLRNREWGLGASSSSGAVIQAVDPPISEKLAGRPAEHDGIYFVPSALVRVLNKTPLKGEVGQRVIVKVEIDERGRIVKVTPMTDAPPYGLEDTLRAWRFAPYTIDGRRVRVSTTLVLAVE